MPQPLLDLESTGPGSSAPFAGAAAVGGGLDLLGGLAMGNYNFGAASNIYGDYNPYQAPTFDRATASRFQGQAQEFGAEKGGRIGSGIGTGVGVGVAALTGGAAAPLIPLFSKAGETVGGLFGGESASRKAEEQVDKEEMQYMEDLRRFQTETQKRGVGQARREDIGFQSIYNLPKVRSSLGYSQFV